MPLHILALLVVVGLAAIIAAVHFSGGSRAIAPMTEAQARQRFMDDHQTFEVADCHVADDGRTALVFGVEPGQGGVVLQMGDRLVTRRLGPDFVAAISQTSAGLDLALRDFTLPKMFIALANANDRTALIERLHPMTLENA
jgi:hypothetical protein